MNDILNQIDWEAMILAIQETMYMTLVSLLVAVIIGFILGVILYVTKEDGLYPMRIINSILNFIVNLLR
ncbi:MAG: ABC transporter permease, partial [Coprobacillus sp.]